MGKQSKKNKKAGSNSKPADSDTKPYDNDTAVFISMAQEHKDKGNKLFQTKDYEGAILKYEKALKLLPGNHIDVSYIRSNIAACYMQMGITDFPRAIHECNLALEVTPRYSKALLKRARCYEALNRLDLALRDGNTVLDIEPRNLMATEIVDRVKLRIQSKPIEDFPNDKMASEIVDTVLKTVPENGTTPEEITGKVEAILEKKCSTNEQEIDSIRVPGRKPLNEKVRKKKPNKTEKKNVDRVEENKDSDQTKVEETRGKNSPEKVEVIENVKKIEDKLVVEEKIRTEDEELKQVVKLVYGDDIRWAKIPVNCDILKLRETVRDRFPVSKAVLIKYRDEEGDMVTITTNEELRWAESSVSDHRTAVRLYVIEVNPEHDLFFDHLRRQERNRKLTSSSGCIDNWILEFAQLFKNYVGFDSDAYLDLHELGMKLYSEAMEDTATSEEAQELFRKAADKFQEMTALALFNWGNVHMSRARKRVDGSRETVVKDSYERAKTELSKAGEKYEESIEFKPDFYEGFLALGQQRFEKAKLSWNYALGKNTNLETWDSSETVRLYNEAEENIEKGMQMWEQTERDRVIDVSRLRKADFSMIEEEAGDRAANMRSQMNVLWGTMLYERSIMEYKLGIPVWHECLEIAIEKFEVAGASPTDTAVMIKNHCSNHSSPEGLGFNIDEIVQAWNEMYEAKMWQTGIPSFRLEPLLRGRVSKLFHALENA